MGFRPKPLNLGIDGFIVYKIFVDETDRDAYFALHPEELINDMYVYLAYYAKLQRFTKPADIWVDVIVGSGYWIFAK